MLLRPVIASCILRKAAVRCDDLTAYCADGKGMIALALGDKHELVIVEDDMRSAEELCNIINSYSDSDLFSVSTYSSVDELKERLGSHEASIDVLFIDIELGDGELSGIDIVSKYFPQGCGTQVVYVTGHVEYATKVYRTVHIYFLTKPIQKEDLFDALDKALLNLEEQSNKSLLVRTEGSLISLRPSQIIYVESDRRKVRIHIGRTVIETYSSLSEIARMLPSTFVQCHKSFLVNLVYVAQMGKTDILMTSGETIPISQRRKKNTMEAFMGYMRTL